MRYSIGMGAFLAFLVCASLQATADSGASGPALGVARVSVVNGDVAAMRGDSGDWIAAMVNMPLVEGDSIQAVAGSRAEIQLDHGNFLRIGNDTEVQLLELGRRRFRVRVLQGLVLYSEFPRSEADVDIETPLVAVRPSKAGRYRIEVGPDETVIAVREGEAEIAFETRTQVLRSGRTMTVRQGLNGPDASTGRARPKDDFDRWAVNRDKSLRRARAYRYLSRDIYGAEALDDHGTWRHVAGVGYSWFPRVSVAWVPYRHGRWIWLDYYGWCWVGNEAWGWAPYHWGRWYRHARYGWGWYPGAPWLRHTWRPALVAFFGFDHIVRPRIWAGFGSIGWCPLAPGEAYVPWYGAGRYGRTGGAAIVVDNSVNIYNTYRNARGRHAVTYLETRGFGRSARHTPRALRTATLAQGVAIRGPVPVVPDRASQGRVVTASTSVRDRGVRQYGRAEAPSRLRDGTARISFEAQREGIRNSVETFRAGYGTRAARIAATGVRPGTAGAGASTPGAPPATRPTAGASPPAGRTGGVRSTSTVRARSGQSARLPASGRTARSAPAATPPVGAAATSRTAGGVTSARQGRVTRQTRSVGSPASVYAPRARSRLGGSVRPGVGSPGNPRSRPTTSSSASRTGRASAGSRPSGDTGASTASRVQKPASNAATRPARSVQSSTSVYAPRARSRLGGSVRPGVGSPGNPRSRPATSSSASRTGSASVASRPSGDTGASTASRVQRPASNAATRPARSVQSSTSVFSPRTRSRIGASAPSSGVPYGSPGAGRSSTVRTPRNSPRTSSRPSSASPRSGGQAPSRVYAPRNGSRVGAPPGGGSRSSGGIFSSRRPSGAAPSRPSRAPTARAPSGSSRSTARTPPSQRSGGQSASRVYAPSARSRASGASGRSGGGISPPRSNSTLRAPRARSSPSVSRGSGGPFSPGSAGSVRRSAPRAAPSRPSSSSRPASGRSSGSREAPSRSSGARR